MLDPNGWWTREDHRIQKVSEDGRGEGGRGGGGEGGGGGGGRGGGGEGGGENERDGR